MDGIMPSSAVPPDSFGSRHASAFAEVPVNNLLSTTFFGLETDGALFWGIAIACVLFLALLVPYLVKEIQKGKAQRRAGTPIGAGDVRTGTVGNPAPGQPDAQADPYSVRARRYR
jgi:hypothetical protein